MILFILFISFYTQFWCLNADNSDEIHNLPNLSPTPTFRQYSGYLNATEGKHIFYWFVESESNPAKDPLVLWLNGGPGCSGLESMFTLNGPYRVSDDGINITYDKNSWNKFTNVLYIESPAGVGFSYSDDDDIKTNDNQTAEDNYQVLKNFYLKYPQFKQNDLYITGLSYAGIFIPTLSVIILRDDPTINLKGIAIGNGYLDPTILMNSRPYFAYYHGLIDSDLWNDLVNDCCVYQEETQICDFMYGLFDFENKTPINESQKLCRNKVEILKQQIIDSKVYIHGIYDNCHNSDQYTANLPSNDFELSHFSNSMQSLGTNCPSNGFVSYLNNEKVRKEIHVYQNASQWDFCNPQLYSFEKYTLQYSSMKSHFEQIIHKHNLGSIIIYNGDSDLVCDFLGNQWFVNSLNLPVKEKYHSWRINGQTAGFVKRYKGLTFATVKGSGHLVFDENPEAGVYILKELIGKSKLV